MIKIKKIIGTAMMAALFFSCSQDNIITGGGETGDKITFKVEGDMPSGDENKTRAYMGNDRGVYWMEGDNISVISAFLDEWGFDINFTAVSGSEGKKKTTFTNTDYVAWNNYYFQPGTWFTACYPTMQVKPREGEPNVTMERVSTMPVTQAQEGESSRHLKETMVMFSGVVNIPSEGLAEENGAIVLPPIKFQHRTAVHRFCVTNRREYPIQIKSVRMTALKAGEEVEYPVFNEEINFHMGTLEPVEYGVHPHKYREVTISQNGNPYYTLEPGGSVYLYASSFATDLSSVDLKFTVNTNDGMSYNTLAISGAKIQNGKFEDGMCYTYDLWVDYNLTLQDWNVDYIDNVNFGQNDFTLSTDNILLPLDGSSKETVTVNTSDASGWTITGMPEWIAVSKTSGNAGESQVTFSAQPNGTEREGTICMTSGNMNKYLKVTQTDNIEATDEIKLKVADMDDKSITSYILQDDEPIWQIQDNPERSFYTMEPLQSEITSDGKLHLRFYSPRKLTDVQVWAKIPSIVEEEFLLATLEEMAPFADVYVPLPEFGKKDCKFRTISGEYITFKEGPTFSMSGLKLRVTSSCPYWEKLKAIKVNWRVTFGKAGYYQDFNTPGWSMQPSHCREAVALTLNNTYMFSTTEYRDYLYSLQGQLYTDNQGKNFVDTHHLYNNVILKARDVRLGITTYGGFAGGSTWYFTEDAYLTHYADDAVSFLNDVSWHELGHVLGYGHDGNMTYPNSDHVGWATNTAACYYYMSRDKKLPIYSRRFLHTRDTETSYLYRESNRNPVKEWHSFGTTPEEDAELYEIDGGDLWYNQ